MRKKGLNYKERLSYKTKFCPDIEEKKENKPTIVGDRKKSGLFNIDGISLMLTLL